MYIYLIRHGETNWNDKLLFQGHTDVPLNKKGKLQAKMIANEFKKIKFDYIFSSDLSRAYETAGIIKKLTGFNGKIIKSKELRERNYGSFEGKEYELLRHKKSNFDGEKDIKFFKRINSFFDSIIKNYKNKDIVIVTHGGVVRQIIAYILGLKDYKRIRIYNASISEIYYNEKSKKFFLLRLNSMAHLSYKERIKIHKHIIGV
jgi:broad specificity phosphatase PhoE